MSSGATLPPEQRVLSTLENDGSRRWLHPKLAKGRFLERRRIVAYALLAIYTLVPFITINGKPALLFDIGAGRFTAFGATFLPTDTILLALLMLIVFLGIFAATAVAGRVWCGWACPQTVYMEFVFRPIERLFIGNPGKGGKPRKAVAGWRYIAMYVVFFLVCLHLANTFLAYFVGVEKLHDWIWTSPPWAHPTAFGVVMFVTGLMMFDFCYWREQLCIIGCPYGRFQSVLLDRGSLIVGYDVNRGEPRGKLQKKTSDLPIVDRGDCVDCKLCVLVCPTGIDIRDGLQLECVGCTQCIDACDDVMDKVGKPRGLIRYSSQSSLDGEKTHIVRPRVVIYSLLFGGLISLFAFLLITKSPFDFTALRDPGRQFVIRETGLVENSLQLKIVNRTDSEQVYRVTVPESPEIEIKTKQPEFRIDPGDTRTIRAKLLLPRSAFQGGELPITIRATDDSGAVVDRNFTLLGPISAKSGG